MGGEVKITKINQYDRDVNIVDIVEKLNDVIEELNDRDLIAEELQKLKNVAKPGGDSRSDYPQLSDVLALFESYKDLLIEAKHLYSYYPNNFRKTVDEYFSEEMKIKDKLSEHF